MSGWSKGWMKTAPVSCAYSWAAASVSSTTCPCSRTCAPYSRVAATLGSGAPTGMKTVDRTPSSADASATPCAWFPALAATTPAARSTGERPEMRTYAPRSLNDPVRCRFSHLNWTGAPTRADRWRLPSSGVTRETPESIFCAPRTSSRISGGKRPGGAKFIPQVLQLKGVAAAAAGALLSRSPQVCAALVRVAPGPRTLSPTHPTPHEESPRPCPLRT